MSGKFSASALLVLLAAAAFYASPVLLELAQSLGWTLSLIVICTATGTIAYVAARAQIRVIQIYALLVLFGAVAVAFVRMMAQLPPLLFLALVVAAVGSYTALFFNRRPDLREKRTLMGLCPACGYDLRASVERCPECGEMLPPHLKRRRGDWRPAGDG